MGATQKSSDPPPGPEPVERAVVALAEIRFLALDRDGKALDDLRGDEIRVLEGGVEQRLAFLETVAGGRERPAVTSVTSPSAVGPGSTDDTLVLPPRAVRRIVFALDFRNSRKSSRRQWRDALETWVRTEMRSDDRVGLVSLAGYPEWWVDLTNEPADLREALASKSFERAASGRDRNRDMALLMGDVRECFGDDGTRIAAGDEVQCAYEVSRPRVHQWNAEARDTVLALEALVGQLAAVPGRKAVLLLSEGLLPDASMVAVDAMVANLGSTDLDLDVYKMKARFGKDVLNDLERLEGAARAADVTFFSLDTLVGDTSGFAGNLEHTATLPALALGRDPFRAMTEATHGSLDALALETGGRAHRGLRDLADGISAAAGSFFGMYTLGYYRSDPDVPVGEVRLEVSREGVDVIYRPRAEVPPDPIRAGRLELVIGKPRPGQSGSQILPVAARVAWKALPLREAGGDIGTVIAVHFQATRFDGTVVAEQFAVRPVGVPRDRHDEVSDENLLEHAELVLAPGEYWLRVRMTDDRGRFHAERGVSVEVGPGTVRPA